MSEFAVTIEAIDKVWEHPNADKLELASVTGKVYQFVVPKGQYHPGKLVVFFPIDSLIPVPLLREMGLEGRLSGPNKNRLKTVWLRDEISQGLVEEVYKLSILKEHYANSPARMGHDVTEVLGVTKYEPPATGVGKNIRTSTLLPGDTVYDIESAQNYPQWIEMLMDVPVLITEKLEGTHFSAHFVRDTGEIAICTRRQRIIQKDMDLPHGSRYLQAWEQADAEGFLCYLAQYPFPDANVVTLRGELIGPGIQGNIYELNKHQIRLFDIELDFVPVPIEIFYECLEDMESFFPECSLAWVPVIAGGAKYRTLRQFLNGQSVAEYSDGPSVMTTSQPILREGIVIKPWEELYDGRRRVFVKQRSPEYLAGSDA